MRRLWLLVLGGAGGTWLGYRLARPGMSAPHEAIVTLAESLVRQSSFSTAAPIVATGLAAFAAITAAVAVPLTVLWALSRMERKDE